MFEFLKRLISPRQKDSFEELEKRVEQEAHRIRNRRKQIEQEALRESIELDGATSDASRAKLTAKRLVNASVCASQEDDVAKAIAALRVATETDDRCWEAYYNLGWHYLLIGKKIHEPYMGTITVSDAGSFHESLATRMSFYERAIKHLRIAIDLNPTHAKGWCLLGQALYYMAEYDEARSTLCKAIDLDPHGEGGRMAAESLAILENTLG